MVVTRQSVLPDLSQGNLKAGEELAGVQLFSTGNALRFTVASSPDLDSLFDRQQQPTELGAIEAIALHLLAKGRDSARTFVGCTGQLDHQVRTKRGKTAALVRVQTRPALEPHQRRIRTED